MSQWPVWIGSQGRWLWEIKELSRPRPVAAATLTPGSWVSGPDRPLSQLAGLLCDWSHFTSTFSHLPSHASPFSSFEAKFKPLISHEGVVLDSLFMWQTVQPLSPVRDWGHSVSPTWPCGGQRRQASSLAVTAPLMLGRGIRKQCNRPTSIFI